MNDMKEKNAAIVLSAGKGSRMKNRTAKQYLLLNGRPVICYSLEAFQRCPFIEKIVLVAGTEDLEFCRKEIVERYGFDKVRSVVPGGKERYDSVYEGLKECGACDYVYIHDGARPFLTEAILTRTAAAVRAFGACAVGMPAKDTIRLSDEKGFCADTPDRNFVWQMQTPQAFSYELIFGAYQKLMKEKTNGALRDVTDDVCVLERTADRRAKLVEGAYGNLKITTPEDLKLAEILAKTWLESFS